MRTFSLVTQCGIHMRVAGALSRLGNTYSGKATITNKDGETANIVNTLDLLLLGIGRKESFTVCIDGDHPQSLVSDICRESAAVIKE